MDGRKAAFAELSLTTISGQCLSRDKFVKRREETSPSLRTHLSALHVKGLAVVLVGDLFNAGQKGRCVGLVRAALPLQ